MPRVFLKKTQANKKSHVVKFISSVIKYSTVIHFVVYILSGVILTVFL